MSGTDGQMVTYRQTNKTGRQTGAGHDTGTNRRIGADRQAHCWQTDTGYYRESGTDGQIGTYVQAFRRTDRQRDKGHARDR